MKIYTSYFGRLNMDRLAPTWLMMQMQLPKFWESYAEMLEHMDAREVAESLWRGRRRGCEAIALLCYEKDAAECHRHVVADWMTKAGIEVVEWEPSEKSVVQEDLQMTLF